MKVAIHRLSTAGLANLLEMLIGFGASYALFGDRILIYGPDAISEEIVRLTEGAGLTLHEYALPEYALPVDADNLYLVIQTGSLFERAHPNVPIILNASRHLVVGLDRESAARISQASSGYKIQLLEPNKVIFDLRKPPANLPQPLPWIQKLTQELSATNLKRDLEYLVGFSTRHSFSEQYARAAEWAAERFRELGYEPELDQFSIDRDTSINVIARPQRSDGVQDIVLVVAHLDSINLYGPAWPAPGADDNGSGSVGLLEVARVMKDHHGKHELRFVLFGGEEQLCYGSDYYVNRLRADKELERVKAVVCMDMIGCRNGTDLSVFLEGTEISNGLIDRLSAAAFSYSSNLIIQTSPYHLTSDHWPFIKAGRPAVLTIEGNGTTSNTNIHSSDDTLSTVDYELMLAILRMNTAFIAQAVGPGSLPPVERLRSPSETFQEKETVMASDKDTQDSDETSSEEQREVQMPSPPLVAHTPIIITDGSASIEFGDPEYSPDGNEFDGHHLSITGVRMWNRAHPNQGESSHFCAVTPPGRRHRVTVKCVGNGKEFVMTDMGGSVRVKFDQNEYGPVTPPPARRKFRNGGQKVTGVKIEDITDAQPRVIHECKSIPGNGACHVTIYDDHMGQPPSWTKL